MIKSERLRKRTFWMWLWINGRTVNEFQDSTKIFCIRFHFIRAMMLNCRITGAGKDCVSRHANVPFMWCKESSCDLAKFKHKSRMGPLTWVIDSQVGDSIHNIWSFSKPSPCAKHHVSIILIRNPVWLFKFILYLTAPTAINCMRPESNFFSMCFCP